jgi:hypothetical protein
VLLVGVAENRSNSSSITAAVKIMTTMAIVTKFAALIECFGTAALAVLTTSLTIKRDDIRLMSRRRILALCAP